MTALFYSAPISIAMATYNGLPYIREQLDSIFSEMAENDELIIVDDGSTDGTVEFLKNKTDARLKLHLHSINQGVLATFNEALSFASHEIIFLSDQDDIWLPGKRNAFADIFHHDNKCLLVISDARIIDGSGTVIRESFMQHRGGFRSDLLSNLFRNRFLGCCMALHRRLLQRAMPVPLSVPMHDMWFGAIATLRGGVRYNPKAYLDYRRHGGNVSPSHRASLYQMLVWRISLALALLVRQVKFQIVGKK
jgi:cellulose synthase/poly-beta-1,6-N-acetylglucosamine synthase-like glycosyltransferase